MTEHAKGVFSDVYVPFVGLLTNGTFTFTELCKPDGCLL